MIGECRSLTINRSFDAFPETTSQAYLKMIVSKSFFEKIKDGCGKFKNIKFFTNSIKLLRFQKK